MTESDSHSTEIRPAGYTALTERLGLHVIPNWHKSFVAMGGGTQRTHVTGGLVQETYTPRYWPGDGLGDQLEFALKYDGTNLAILASLFLAMDTKDFAAYVQSRPMGKYARRLWYLYELITGQRLPVADLTSGNYVDLLDPETHYTVQRPRQVRRQRINDNLLGDSRFCPTIRRTESLRRFEAVDLRQRCQQVVAAYPPELLKRALSYLYTKETKSSFEIEHIQPDANRTERFIALLQLAEKEDFCDKPPLVDLQNRIVDVRFAATDYRTIQNYVGQTVALNREEIHFACPKPGDLPDMMAGLIAANQRMAENGAHPVAQAAAVAYGFVFLHPFEDGNGRIHRFLIHNVLARRGVTPEGLMFPVSAVMLKNLADYDASLEAFSRPLMPLVEYSLDDEGRMTVHNDTAVWYRYIDMTPQAEALFAFIERTIDTELADELAFLANYDRTKAALQAIVDMPDRQIDLFIRFCLQNHGRLSGTKRARHFSLLTDDEVTRMERAIREAYGDRATE
ncbi:MAG: Fic family protein [Planctomycetota bacterium]|nr:Fic family protein [Planctomycetota bacterium]